MTLRGIKGFSLLEIVVALGLLGLLGLAVSGLVKNIGGQQSAMVAKDEASEFVAALSLWLGTDKGCQTGLGGKTLPVGGSSPVVIDGFNGFGVSRELNNGTSAFRSGYRITPFVRIKSLVLKDKGIAPVVVSVENVKYRRVVAQLQIELEQQKTDGASPTSQPQRMRFVEVPVLLQEGADVIARCAGEPTLSDLCSAVGSAVDPSTGACKPQVNCTMQGTFMTLSCSPSDYGCYNSSGMPLENAITHAQSCPPGSVASQTGIFNYSHEVECGKKCTATISDQLVFYLCMRCN